LIAVNWWDLDSLGQLWFAAENKIGGKYDDWECTKQLTAGWQKTMTLLSYVVVGETTNN
jgi:hypothetical protein